ncbi:hypothetical protein RBSWK_01081 [Rhodopirellula baltica SWK14]|uniref:Uncharacterized protein n=1 Tax=Rhodopirellula baltica SWK14 TaxID=993516 RepID=L7CPV1_RHOBT|nr:hypothetical protein RBSWK_01081 [Rhodopirellula baltica SWK14]
MEPISQAGISSSGKCGRNDFTDQRKTNCAILPRPYESRLPTHKPNSVGFRPTHLTSTICVLAPDADALSQACMARQTSPFHERPMRRGHFV